MLQVIFRKLYCKIACVADLTLVPCEKKHTPIMCRSTRLLAYIGCNIFLVNYPCRTTFTANQNAHYISLFIHAQHSSLQEIFILSISSIQQIIQGYKNQTHLINKSARCSVLVGGALLPHPSGSGSALLQPVHSERTSGRLSDSVCFVLFQ